MRSAPADCLTTTLLNSLRSIPNKLRSCDVLWIACGTSDHLIDDNRKFKTWLKSKDITFTDIETPGAHTWMVWRRNLIAFTPLLFNGK